MRYASDGQAPTLYHSRESADLIEAEPGDRRDARGEHARAIVSEPIGKFAEIWAEVPQGSALHAQGGRIAHQPFRPAA